MSTLERRITITAVALPFIGFLVAIVLLWNNGVNWLDLGILAVMYIFTGAGITVGYHRLLTHRSFVCPRWLEHALGIFGTALLYGDGMITPAISVLSAVEGLTTVNAGLQSYVIPLAIGILVGLFAIQRIAQAGEAETDAALVGGFLLGESNAGTLVRYLDDLDEVVVRHAHHRRPVVRDVVARRRVHRFAFEEHLRGEPRTPGRDVALRVSHRARFDGRRVARDHHHVGEPAWRCGAPHPR